MTTNPDQKTCIHHYCRADTLGNGICCRCGNVIEFTFIGYDANWEPQYGVKVKMENEKEGPGTWELK